MGVQDDQQARPRDPLAPFQLERLPMSATLELQALLSRGVQEGAAPGISLAFASRSVGGSAGGAEGGSQTRWRGAALFEGRLSASPHSGWVGAQTIYDLASLTKPLACAWWAWRLWCEGKLDLNLSIGEALKGATSLEDQAIASVPVWRLLNHSAGLPAHRRYYEGFAGERMRGGEPLEYKAWVRRVIARTPAEYAPGTKGVYSDLGFLLLEWVCELSAGERLGEMWARERPVEGLHFNPLSALASPTEQAPSERARESYAPTERCAWRQRTLRGEVHDDNAWLCGGVCGHAGLFGRASDVLAWGMHLVEALQGDVSASESPLKLPQSTLARVVHLKRRPPNSGSFVLGLDTPSLGYSSAGVLFGRESSVGHLGFTGTSLWVDYERGRVVALLSNRVHPTREQGAAALRWLRPAIHDAVWRLCEELEG